MSAGESIILVDPSEDGTDVLAGRLRMQGYSVIEVADAATGARLALSEPPTALVADLWMRGISGVQLCRLLKAEAATEHVPVILRGPSGPRNTFWAERAGAAAYVTKGRMGDLLRALRAAIALAPIDDAFFTQLGGDIDIRDRIAAHLDAALFESVVAAEVRALGASGSFDRFFDRLTQFASRVAPYRWLAIVSTSPANFAVHSSPRGRARCEREARQTFDVNGARSFVVEDGDAVDDEDGPPPLVRHVHFGGAEVGRVALAQRRDGSVHDVKLVDVMARELGGPIRIVALVEESQRLATLDPLTGLMNRRAFLAELELELARATRHRRPMSLAMVDVDHFKQVNDTFGHAGGDLVLSAVGALLQRSARKGDLVARWGGEEFIVALHMADLAGGMTATERVREALAELEVFDGRGHRIAVTGSFGVAELTAGERLESLIERADQAMYEAKKSGRNRVAAAPERAPPPQAETAAE